MATGMQALDRYQSSDIRKRHSGERSFVREVIHAERRFDGIIGRSAALTSVLTQLELVAPTDATVLIHGETGTGKELLARALHTLSARRTHPLVTLNCAAIPPSWKANSSATRKAPSRARSHSVLVVLNWPTRGRFSLTKSATSPSNYNPSS